MKITHMTTKLLFSFQNNNDLTSSTTATAQILFAKSGVDVPVISDLYEQDANGNYTPMSMANTQQYSKYAWIKSLKHKIHHEENVNRYPLSSGRAQTANPEDGVATDFNVDTPANTNLNLVDIYSNKYAAMDMHVHFQNGSDTIVEQYKPYHPLRS